MWESFLGPHNTTFKPGKDDVQVLRFCKILNVNGVPFESHQRCLPALLPPRVWKKSVGRGSELLAICACNARAIHDYFGSWTLLLKDQNTSSYLSLYNSKRWPQSCPCSESYGFSGSKMICIFLNWQHQSPFLILLLFFFFLLSSCMICVTTLINILLNRINCLFFMNQAFRISCVRMISVFQLATSSIQRCKHHLLNILKLSIFCGKFGIFPPDFAIGLICYIFFLSYAKAYDFVFM